MKEFMHEIKIDIIVTSVVCMVLGVVLILFPEQVGTVACQAVGVILAVLGGVRLVTTLLTKVRTGIDLPLGLLLVIVGIWFVLNPSTIEKLIFIGVGVILFCHGIKGIQMSFEAKRGGYPSWPVLLLLSLANVAFGVVCVIDSFGVFKLASAIVFTLMGVALIYDGVISIYILSRVRKVAKEVKQDLEAIDTTYEEMR